MIRKLKSILLAIVLIINIIPMGIVNASEENNSFAKPEYMDLLDDLIESELKYGLSGAQIAVYKDGELVKNSAYGFINNYENVYNDESIILGQHNVLDISERIPVTTETLFDLASNTKMYATVYALQKLVSEGRISLSTKISEIFPEFLEHANENGWKDKIDLRMVLSHRAGFAPDPQYHNENYDEDDQIKNGINDLYSQDRALTFEMIMKTPLNTEPDTAWAYSDVDMMLAGFIVEELTGMNLDEYVKESFYNPLGLDRITFNPLSNGFTTSETSSSELNGNTRDGRILFNNVRKSIVSGEVHDEKAYYSMDGISGHAGLFGTAQQIAYLAQAMIYNGTLKGVELFNQQAIDDFVKVSALATQTDGGWRRKSETGGATVWYSKFAPAGTIGHTGWTGTNTLIDKDNGLTLSLNTNARNTPIMGPGANDFYTKNSNISSYGLVSEIIYRALGIGNDEIQSADDLLIKIIDAEIPDDLESQALSKRNVIRSLLDVLEYRKTNSSLLEEYYNSKTIQSLLKELESTEYQDMKNISNIDKPEDPEDPQDPQEPEDPVDLNELASVDEIIDNMTLRQKINQLLMIEFRNWQQDGESAKSPVTELNDEIKDIIQEYQFGGVILFAPNVVGTEQTTKLTHDLQNASIDSGGLPLLLSVDQEGGIVVRLGTGTSLPGNMALGANGSPEDAYRYGQIIAEELTSLGINVNLAPVLDVNNNPNNPVIHLRSISSDPNLVAEIGTQMLKGIQDKGVSASVKHFPGHGDTAVDSHLGLPEVDKSYEEVEKLELVPFMKAAREGADMIMTAHISYPQLEPDTAISKKDGNPVSIPATLSDDILTGIIRDKMGYNGIIITDALGMKAITEHFGELDTTLISLKAGTDILLMPTVLEKKSDLEKLDLIIENIEQAVTDGEVTEARINESVRRILELKQRRGILDTEQYKKPLADKIANALNTVGSAEHLKDQREITQRAITVGINKNRTLPIYPRDNESVLFLTPYATQVNSWNYGFTRLQTEGGIPAGTNYNTIQFTKDTTREELEELIKGYDYVIVASHSASAANLAADHFISRVPTEVTEIAQEQGKKSVVVSIAQPYDLGRYKDADAMLLAYGNKGMDPTEPGEEPKTTFGPNIPTAVDIIFGKVASSGTLPVDVPKLSEDYKYTDEIEYPLGFGLVTILTNTNELEDEIANAEGKLNEDLDEKRSEYLESKITEAKELLASDSITQEEVDNMVKALRDAIENIEKYDYKLDIKLVDKKIEDLNPELEDKLNKKYPNGYDYKVYEITLKDQFDIVYLESDNPMEIKIQLSELGFNSEQIKDLLVINNHIDENDEMTLIDLDYEIIDEELVFESDKFSDFIIAAPKVDEEETGDSEIGGDGSSTDTGRDGKGKTKPKPNPRTGDVGIGLAALSFAIAGGASILLLKKRKKNK